MGRRASRLAAVPPIGRPRWLLPRSGRAAVAGLDVYQPMTRRGRVIWEGARLAARVGALRLVPGRFDPEIEAAVGPHLREGWSMAVSFGSDRRRGVVLIIDEHGVAVLAAKVAFDAAGRERLADEADRMERLALGLAPPLRAPRIVEHSEGILVLEAVRWRARPRPWFMPAALAAGIGHFHHGSRSTAARPGHGDFAPWNVMQTSAGWALLDWEEARADAPPYADPFHFLVQGHALLGRPHAEEILDGLEGRGWIGRALGAYAHAARLDGVDPREALSEYLGRSMPPDSGRADHDRGRRSRVDLLRRLGGERR